MDPMAILTGLISALGGLLGLFGGCVHVLCR